MAEDAKGPVGEGQDRPGADRLRSEPYAKRRSRRSVDQLCLRCLGQTTRRTTSVVASRLTRSCEISLVTMPMNPEARSRASRRRHPNFAIGSRRDRDRTRMNAVQVGRAAGAGNAQAEGTRRAASTSRPARGIPAPKTTKCEPSSKRPGLGPPTQQRGSSRLEIYTDAVTRPGLASGASRHIGRSLRYLPQIVLEADGKEVGSRAPCRGFKGVVRQDRRRGDRSPKAPRREQRASGLSDGVESRPPTISSSR